MKGVSVVVIARNEARALEKLLPRLRAMPEVCEVVLADGHSSDASLEVAQKYGALVAQSQGGRGAQAREGASRCSGEIVWFLHADCFPARSAARSLVRAARDPRVSGGNFRLHFSSRSRWARFFELVARVQRIRGIYYGDSGIWARREVYKTIGGVQAWPLFEDLDFARRLETFARTHRQKTLCLRPALLASARRFDSQPLRTLRLWLQLQAAFQRGESPESLAARYHRERG